MEAEVITIPVKESPPKGQTEESRKPHHQGEHNAPRTMAASPLSPSSPPIPASSSPSIETIPSVPPPWTLHADVYCVSFWTSRAKARSMPKDFLYSPPEARSSYADHELQKPVGGLGMIQILRYTESPVGPYDELIIMPGLFELEREGADGRRKKKKTPKITRIYVSQKHTCYNGRLNWNVPKHLAKFDWDVAPDGAMTVKVFPHDISGDAHETLPSAEPYFQTTFKPARFMPSFPFSTGWLKHVGFDLNLVLPPLPAGSGSQGELPGTERWCSTKPDQYCRRASLGWFDMSQRKGGKGGADAGRGGGGGGDGNGEHENFWPGMGRWQLGMKMENATIRFGPPEETWGPEESSIVKP